MTTLARKPNLPSRNPRIDALLAALPHLDEDAHLTISVRVGDLRSALAKTTNPLRRLTPQEASAEFGYTRRWWQGQAAEIAGAVRDGAGRWRIPFAAAERHVSLARSAERREERFRGKTKAKRAKAGAEEREVDGGSAAVAGREVHTSTITVPPLLAEIRSDGVVVPRGGAVGVRLLGNDIDIDQDDDLALALEEHPPEGC